MYSQLHYVKLVENAYSTKQGVILGRLVSLGNPHVFNPHLWLYDINSEISGSQTPFLDDLLVTHLLSVKAVHLQKYDEAFKQQCLLLVTVCKMSRVQQDSAWIGPVLMTVCVDLCMIAQHTDVTVQKRGFMLEKAAAYLLSCLPDYTSGPTTTENSESPAFSMTVDQFLYVYSKVHQFSLFKSLIRVVEPAINASLLYIAEQRTFECYPDAERLAAPRANLPNAKNYLECSASNNRLKRVIFTYLLSVEELLNYVPGQQLLENNNFILLWHLLTVVNEGKFADFENLVNQNGQKLENMGLSIVLQNLRHITYNNMLKKVYLGLAASVAASETRFIIATIILRDTVKIYNLNRRLMLQYYRNYVFPRSTKEIYHG